MIHAYAGLVVFDVLVAASGYALIDGLGLVGILGGRLRSCGLALLAGWAVLGIVLSLAACYGLYPGAIGTVAVLVLLAGLGVGLRRFFPRTESSRVSGRVRLLERAVGVGGLALVVAALCSALVVAALASADTNWDVWAFWLPKANAIYYFHGLDTGLSGFSTFANPNYPPLFPVVTAATYHLMGGVHPALLPLQQCILGVSFVASVAALLARYARPWILFPSIAMLSLAPEFWGRLPTVLPDQLLGYLLAISALAAALWVVEQRGAWLALSVLLMAAATLTKTEGLMLALLLTVVVVAASLAAHRLAGAPALLLALGPAAILPWRHWLAAHHQPLDSGDYRWNNLFDFHYLSSRTHRLDYAASQLSHFVFYRSIWLLVTPLALAAIVLGVRAAPAVALVLLGWLATSFAGLLATYWIGAPEIHWYVETSARRVIGTLPLVAGTALPLLLGLALGHARKT